MKPLADIDKSAHKLGYLTLIDSFECGLLWNKLNEYLSTSLDGWLQLRPKGDTVWTESKDDEEDNLDNPIPLQINYELDTIMLPCNKLLLGVFFKQEYFQDATLHSKNWSTKLGIRCRFCTMLLWLTWVQCFCGCKLNKILYSIMMRLTRNKLTFLCGCYMMR